MEHRSQSEQQIVRVKVEPGVCGFTTLVEAKRTGRYAVSIKIHGSECKHVKKLAGLVQEMRMKELFSAISVNPVSLAARQAGCHASCPVSVAVLKSAEVAMGMALPGDVTIRFES